MRTRRHIISDAAGHVSGACGNLEDIQNWLWAAEVEGNALGDALTDQIASDIESETRSLRDRIAKLHTQLNGLRKGRKP